MHVHYFASFRFLIMNYTVRFLAQNNISKLLWGAILNILISTTFADFNYLVNYLVRPNQSTFCVGLRPSGLQSISRSFFFILSSSNLLLNASTVLAETTSSLSPFHLFTTLCKNTTLICDLKMKVFAIYHLCSMNIQDFMTRIIIQNGCRMPS